MTERPSRDWRTPVSRIHRVAEHPLTDPHDEQHSMETRVGVSDHLPGYYIWLVRPGQTGWVWGGMEESAQRLLDLEIER